MAKITAEQIAHDILLKQQQGLDKERLNRLFESGLLPDLYRVAAKKELPSRLVFRQALGRGVLDYASHVVQLGQALTTHDLIADIQNSSYASVDDDAQQMILSKGFLISKKVVQVDAACLGVSELGFSNGATFDDVRQAGMDIGFALCPVEFAPVFRVQYFHQPIGEGIEIVSESLCTESGKICHFGIGHVGCFPKREIIAIPSTTDRRLSSGEKVMFMLPNEHYTMLGEPIELKSIG